MGDWNPPFAEGAAPPPGARRVGVGTSAGATSPNGAGAASESGCGSPNKCDAFAIAAAETCTALPLPVENIWFDDAGGSVKTASTECSVVSPNKCDAFAIAAAETCTALPLPVENIEFVGAARATCCFAPPKPASSTRSAFAIAASETKTSVPGPVLNPP